MNWVGQNEDSYFFRPIQFLCNQYGISKNAHGYTVDLERELKDIKAVLFFMAVKRIIAFRHYVAANNGAYHQADANGYIVQSYQTDNISVRLLSKLIDISVSAVHRLKHYAKRLGYLTIQHNSRPVLDYERSYLFAKYMDYLYYEDNTVKIRLTDSLTPFC